jgi:preprotein translocase subunit YajC
MNAHFNMILLQARSGPPYETFIMMGLIFVVFYFFMIRPQQKKQKDQKKFIEELKKGDQVVTLGGMHGKIYAIEGDTIQLEVDRGTKLTFDRASISMESTKRVTKE